MALEAEVVNIADLDPASPAGGDPKSDGDNHIRNIKKALAEAFAGFTGAILVTGVDGGAANVYTLTPEDPIEAYGARMLALFTPIANSTGAVTLNISGLGAKAVLAVDGSALRSGDLTGPTVVQYDGTAFRLLSVTKNFVDQIVVSGTVPGVTDPANVGKFFTATTGGGAWAPIAAPEPGGDSHDKGNSGTTAQVVNFLEGGVPTEGQTITVTGVFNLSASGFPAGRTNGVLLRLNNAGAFPGMTSTGITWIKFDGTLTTTFASAGIPLAVSGPTMLAIFTFGDGTVYGKAA